MSDWGTIRQIEVLKDRLSDTDRAISVICDMLGKRELKADRTATTAAKGLFDRRDELQAEIDRLVAMLPQVPA